MAIERWTDERLDRLADSVHELRESVGELRIGLSDTRESISELRESVRDMRDEIDGLRITSQALLQVAAQHQRDMEAMRERQAESDRRFNILLEEVRYLNRRDREEP